MALAQTPPASQTAGGLIQQRQQIEAQEKLQKEIFTPKPKPEEVPPAEVIQPIEGEKTFVKKIVVEGVTLIPQGAVTKVISSFEGKELSLADMQKVADLITDEYRKRGYVTSRVYLPPQTLKDGILLLNVIEGRMGSIEIKGNRYFKTALLKRKIDPMPKGYFDFSVLQTSLTYINEHPDRTAKAVLVPGKDPGTTDVVVEVKDRLPIHLGYNFDNYASRYLSSRRWTAYAEHNNLLGFDDKFHIEWQQTRYPHSDVSSFRLTQGRYIFPVKRGLDIGLFISQSVSKLGREFALLDSRGKSFLVGLFANQVLVHTTKLDLRWNTGFDYKDIKNYLLGAQSSRDEMRIVKTGLDFDFNDKWGRNIMTGEVDFGIPHIMGGMNSKDDQSSRAGAGSGATFTKWVFNFFRLQPGPFSTEMLFKNSAQISNNNLVAGEQFQLGGPGSVRGYPVGEFSGDKGLYSSVEWSAPLYFFPKGWKVPLMKRTIYESFRFVAFYDWGTIHINRTAAGEYENRTLRGYGFGARINLGENLLARVEFGFPLSNIEPSNNRNIQPWFEITSKF